MSNNNKSSCVWAAGFAGYNMSLAQVFGSGPKMTIKCGSCGGQFTKRIQMVDYPVVVCPCGQANKLNLTVS
jgi:hypothetical protein